MIPITLSQHPHSDSAERAILAAVVDGGPEALQRCIGYGITPASFYQTAPGVIYGEVLSMHADGRPTNIETVYERLEARGLLAEVGGWQGFASLTKSPPLSIEFDAYCREVVALESRRAIITRAQALAEVAATNPDAIAEVFARLLETQARTSAQRSWRRVVATAAQRADDLIAGRQSESAKSLSFGFPDLDRIFQPMGRGEVVVVAARPSCGKSSFMRQISLSAAEAGANVLVESLEVSADDIADSFAATRSGVNRRDLRASSKAAQASFLAALRGLPVERLHVFDGDRSLAAIVARAKSLNAVLPLDLIAIDYLGLIADCEQAGRGETKASAVGRVTKSIKALAMELGCVVILLAQLNRQSVTDGNREPRLSDLRDSGDIEQDADRVIFLHRPSDDPLTKAPQPDTADISSRPRFFVNLIQSKGRSVGTGIVSYYFNRAVTRFEPISRASAPNESDF